MSAASERAKRYNRDTEAKLTGWALGNSPSRRQDVRASIVAGQIERERVANAERLAELAHKRT